MAGDFRAAKGDVEQLGAQLRPAAQAAKVFSEAQNAAKTALDGAKGALSSKQGALIALRKETDSAGKKTDDFKRSEEGLKAAIVAAKTELNQRKSALQQVALEAQKAARAEAALQQEYKGAVAGVRVVSKELQLKRAALSDATGQMARLGVATTDLGRHERNLQGAIAQVRQEVQRMAPAYQQSAAAAKTSSVQQLAATRTLRDGLGEVSQQIQRIQSIAMVALGGNWAISKGKEIADVADSFKNLQARVKLATGEGALFATSWDRVSQIALDTNSALDGTATLFARIADAGKSAGLSAGVAAQQSLGLTQTINQATQLSGGSAESANAAMTQLIQGLQSGVLRGEEFNSIMEQAPRLARALADGLGVTTGELRKMANLGQLTTATVIKALQGQAAVLAAEFETLPATVGRALQNLRTQWTLYVGSSDAGMLSSENAAKSINFLAENLDTLVSTLQTAGKLWAAIKVAQLAGDFGAWATKTLTATMAMEANTVATAANTVAQKANAAAVGAGAAAMGAQAATAKTSAFIQAAFAKNAQNAATFSGQAAKAQLAANAAVAAGGARAAGSAVQMGVLGRSVAGLTGLLGGPVGLLATLVLFNGEIKSGITGVVEWGMGFTDAGKRMRDFEEQQRRANSHMKAQQELANGAAAAQKKYADAQQAARDASFGLTKAGSGVIATFDGLIEKGEKVSEALGKIGKDFDLGSQPGIQNAASVLDKLLADGKITAQQFSQAWTDALAGVDLGVFEVNARAALSGAKRETEQLAHVMDAALSVAIERAGLNMDNLQGRIGAASRSAINDVDAIASSYDRLRAQGVDAAAALQTSFAKAIDTADSSKALDVLRGKLEGLRKELGATVANGLLDQAAKKARQLQIALEEATPGIQSVAEAMRRLGVVSDASLRETATEAKKTYDVIARSGTASQREVAGAFQRAAESAINAANGVAPAWVKTEAAVRGYEISLDRAGNAVVSTERATARAAGRMVSDFDKVGQAADRAGQRIQGMRRAAESQDSDGVKPFGSPNIAERGTTSPIQNLVPANMRTEAQLDAWWKEWQRQYKEQNPFDTKSRGQLGNYMYDTTKFAMEGARKQIKLQQAASSAIPEQAAQASAQGPVVNTAQQLVQTHRHEISFGGRELGAIQTDEAGSNVLQNLLGELERSARLTGAAV